MLHEAKIGLPDTLFSGAMAYASKHHTTLTAMVIEQLEAVTKTAVNDPLVQFSRNIVTKEQAIEAAGLRDYAQLLVAMGDADLPLPFQPEDKIAAQAEVFAQLLLG